MKNLIPLTLALACSCATRETTTNTNPDSAQTDTTQAVAKSYVQPDFSGTTFISYTRYDETTRDFLVDVFMGDDVDFQQLAATADSTVSKSEDEERRRIPMEVAKKSLFLSDIGTLWFYGEDHGLIGKFPLTRVEVINGAVDSWFVAVYSARGIETGGERWYCASQNIRDSFVEEFYTEEIFDDSLSSRIGKQLSLDPAEPWVYTHIKVDPGGTYYSTASLNNNSYLVASEDGNIREVKEKVEDHFYTRLFPIPVFTSGRPIMFINYAAVDTDMFGDYLVSFDGTSYQTQMYNRVKLSPRAQ